MIFRKKRGMIDVRELQRRGIVRIPKKEVVIPTDKDGFVEFGESSKTSTTPKSQTQTNNNFFGFIDSSSSSSTSDQFTTQTDGYNKREVDVKITNLDNKIYKLEQRVELLERKAGVNQSNDESSIKGW